MWIRQVWPHLIPCRKWRSIKKNLQAGDVCLLYFPGSLVSKYKLVRVEKVHPDKNGLVRTVTIMYRKKNKRESKDVYKPSIVKEKVGVQRLILIQPANSDLEDKAEEGQ